MRHYIAARIGAIVLAICGTFGHAANAEELVAKDLAYGTVDGVALRLDLYRPSVDSPTPTIVWIHGGAWRSGSKESVPIRKLVASGYAIASVEYRLSPVARFPAQVVDMRQAIQFLKSNAKQYGLDSDRFAIAGASAGGHLAALVGVAREVQFDGEEELSPEDRAVAAIVSLYGASNLESILAQSTPHGLSVRVPALELLLGGTPETHSELARLASPVTHVDARDPPLLLIHGDQDPQMPINQSHELQGKYEAAGLVCEFRVVHGAAHGGKEFYTAAMLEEVHRFLQKQW